MVGLVAVWTKVYQELTNIPKGIYRGIPNGMEMNFIKRDYKMLKDPKTETNLFNGINVDQWFETVEAVKEDASLARFEFSLDNIWIEGGLNRSLFNTYYGAGEEHTRPSSHYFDNDEPPVLLGNDTSANPAEFLLHALVGCITTSIVWHASARGIKIDKLESKAKGEIDARPILDLPSDVDPGYKSIEVSFRVKSTADNKTIRELANFSPIYHTINGKTPVEITVESY